MFLEKDEKKFKKLKEKIINTRTRFWRDKDSKEKYKDFIETSIQLDLKHEDIQRSYIKILKDYLGDLENKMLLNVGCGLGGFEIASIKEGIIPIGLDINKERLDLSKLRAECYGVDINYVAGEGSKLPFKGVFDIVVNIGTIEHIENPKEFIYEMFDALKPGGHLFLIITPNKFFPYDMHFGIPFITWIPKSIRNWIFSRLPEYLHIPIYYYSPQQVMKFIKPYSNDINKFWPDLINNRLEEKREFIFDSNFEKIKKLFKTGLTKKIFIKFVSFLSKINMEMEICILAKKLDLDE